MVLTLLEHMNPALTSGAVRLVGEMGITEAAPKLAGLIVHPEMAVGLSLIGAAQLLREASTTEMLVGALSDEESEVRVAAAEALAALGHEGAVPVLKELVTGKELRQADLTEKIAFFESYGALGGAGAVDVLSDILNKKEFLGRREPSEIRASAARALGKAGLPNAQAALQAAQKDEDAVVRTAVRHALQGPGEAPGVEDGSGEASGGSEGPGEGPGVEEEAE